MKGIILVGGTGSRLYPLSNVTNKHLVLKSDYTVTGLYLFNNGVEIIKTLRPSGRVELDITDVNKEYIRKCVVGYSLLDGYWSDAGMFESLLRVGIMLEREVMKMFFRRRICRIYILKGILT